MPRCDGLRVVEEIRQKSDQTPILVMTGYADESPEAFVMGFKNIALIKKPFTYSAFMEEAHGLLRTIEANDD